MVVVLHVDGRRPPHRRAGKGDAPEAELSDALHPWVNEFNKERWPDKYFGKDWTRLRPDLDYAKYSGPDDVVGEGTGHKQGRTFPHAMKGGQEKPGKAYYEAFTTSPYASEVLWELAKRAIDAEQLGQRDTCDLLSLSFSSNDLVGHAWGPDSQEVLDMTLRTDLLLKDLLNHLDAKVGRGKYVVVLSADHGVGPIPEVAKAAGKETGRVPPEVFKARAAEFLQETFAKGQKMQRYFRDIQMYLVHPSAQPIVQSLYAMNYLGLGAGLPGMS